MTCKHRWEPTNLHFAYVPPSSYRYCCARCGNVIWTKLKEKQA